MRLESVVDNSKKIKKGEVLLKEGDSIDSIFLIKTGRFGLFIERNGKKIELGQLGPGQIVGEKAIFAPSKHTTSIIALNDSSYLEMPAKLIKDHFEKSDAMTKVIAKGLSDALFETRKNIQSIKMETDSMPCGQKMVAKVCATIYMTTNLVGKKVEDHTIVSWGTLKLYSNRLFLEPHSRVQGFIEILTKLKFAEMIYKKNDEGEEELSDIKLLNVKLIEDFGDFYQYQYYKGSRSEVIFVDKLAMKCAEMILELSEGAEIDHKGSTNLEFEKFYQDAKAKYNFEFKSNHFDLLEKKGLFATRRNRNDKVYLSFDREEFRKTSTYWKLIHEIDKWNERGFVNMAEKEESLQAPPPGTAACASCSSPLSAQNKFCPNCGTKVAA